MKNFFACLSFVAVLMTVACSNQSPEAKKEIIVVPASPTIIVKDPPQKSTTITVDKNGVKVGTKKIDVTLKKQ